jgi:N6-adenosine-specific RNA methylase IME4
VSAPINEDQALALVNAARMQLAQAETVQDFAVVAKHAEAIRYLTKKAGLALEASNAAARLKVDAERRAGALLLQLKEEGEYGPGVKSSMTDDLPPHVTTYRWQDMARVPDAVVNEILKTHEQKQQEITSAQIQHIGARIRRMEVIQERDEALHVLPVDERPVPVIYADPPWRYDYSVSGSREIENQYPTMTLSDICAVDPIPAEDAVLFMWTTSPKLRESFDVIDAWGFKYRTSMVWVKPQIGMGYYARQQHELLLIATLGNLPTPEPENRPPSVIEAPRTQHSAKPDLWPMLDAMYPGLWKREMFSRRPAEGLWLVHGNDEALS